MGLVLRSLPTRFLSWVWSHVLSITVFPSGSSVALFACHFGDQGLASRSLHTCIVLWPYSVMLRTFLNRCVPSRSATDGYVMCTGVGVHDRGLPVRQLHAVRHRPLQPLRVVQPPSLQPGHGRGGEPVHHPQQHVVHCRLSHAARYVSITCARGAGGRG